MPYCIALLKKCSHLGKKTYKLSLDSGWKLATLCSEYESILCYHKMTLLPKKKKKNLGGVKYKRKKPKIDQQSRGFKKQNKNVLTFLPWN